MYGLVIDVLFIYADDVYDNSVDVEHQGMISSVCDVADKRRTHGLQVWNCGDRHRNRYYTYRTM